MSFRSMRFAAIHLLALSLVALSFGRIRWNVTEFHCKDGEPLELTHLNLPETTGTRSYPLFAVQEDRLDSDKLLALFGGSLLQINKQTNSHRIYRLSSDLNSGTHLAFDFVQSNDSTAIMAAYTCLIVFSRNESDCTERYRIGNCDADPWADPELVDGDFSVARFGGIINIELLEDNIVFMADIGSVRKVDFIHRRVDTYRLVPNLEDMSINGGFVYTLRSGPSGQEITVFSQNTTIATHTCPSDAPCAEKGVFYKFSAVSPGVLLGIPHDEKPLVLWDLETKTKRPLCEPGVCSVKYPMDMSAVGTTIYIGSVWQAQNGGGLYDIKFAGDCDQLRLTDMYVQFPYTMIYLDGDKVGIGCHYDSHNVSHSAPNRVDVICSKDEGWSGLQQLPVLECIDLTNSNDHVTIPQTQKTTARSTVAGENSEVTGKPLADSGTTDRIPTDGRVTDRTYTDGGVTDRTSTDGGVTDRTSTDGGVTDRAYTDGGVTDRTPTDGRVTGRSYTDSGVTDRTLTDGGVIDRTSKDGSSSDDGTPTSTTGNRAMTHALTQETTTINSAITQSQHVEHNGRASTQGTLINASITNSHQVDMQSRGLPNNTTANGSNYFPSTITPLPASGTIPLPTGPGCIQWMVVVTVLVAFIVLFVVLLYVFYRRRQKRRQHVGTSVQLDQLFDSQTGTDSSYL